MSRRGDLRPVLSPQIIMRRRIESAGKSTVPGTVSPSPMSIRSSLTFAEPNTRLNADSSVGRVIGPASESGRMVQVEEFRGGLSHAATAKTIRLSASVRGFNSLPSNGYGHGPQSEGTCHEVTRQFGRKYASSMSSTITRVGFARRTGYRKITLWTNSVLHSARHIYERAGFRKVSEEAHHSYGHDLVSQTRELKL